jgi:hypothetical protein
VAVRSVIESQVLEDDRDNFGILDAGDDLDRPATPACSENPAHYATRSVLSVAAAGGRLCSVNALRPRCGPNAMR